MQKADLNGARATANNQSSISFANTKLTNADLTDAKFEGTVLLCVC